RPRGRVAHQPARGAAGLGPRTRPRRRRGARHDDDSAQHRGERMKSAKFDYVRPAGEREAQALLAASGGMGKPVAGSQSLGPMMNMRLAQPELLVDVRGLPALLRCEEGPDAVT